jgi:histidinol-phosphate aminotransferase
VIRRLRDYYRQFEELSPEEISVELRERRDAERASALAQVPPLDLSTPAWHEPPDPEAVNAATYALRRAVNTYPDDGPLREAIASRHGVAADRVAPGHGAGELLHAAFRAIGVGGRVAVAWPGWGPLPRIRTPWPQPTPRRSPSARRTTPPAPRSPQPTSSGWPSASLSGSG